MNLPNKLTISRIVLAFLVMLFLFVGHARLTFPYIGRYGQYRTVFSYLALLTFIIATLTDFWDGYLARRFNQVTDFGKFMDPVADKLLIFAPFLAFVELKIVPAWMVVVIIFREMLITGMRLLAARKGKVIPASMGGKHKTVSQFVAIYTILIFLCLKETAIKRLDFWNESSEVIFRNAVFVLMLVVVCLTLTSGFFYLWRNKEIIFERKNR